MARLAQRCYDEVNLNCGCPSTRVQRGAFGACLMAEPALVRDCVAAMRDAVSLPVTVKHRIGIDRIESYGFVRDFVGVVGEGGCSVFIVHARNAWLDGLSPKRNREVPPLRRDTVAQLKADFPQWTFVVNGGLLERSHRTRTGALTASCSARGLPQPLASDQWGPRLRARVAALLSRDTVELEMVRYMEQRATHDGTPWTAIALAHDGAAIRPARGTSLAPGVVGSSAARAAARRGDAARTPSHGHRTAGRRA
jgi:tRNA-dihydrouridine synthase A